MTDDIRKDVSYGNAEVRGQLRIWKKRLAQNYAVFNSSFKLLQSGAHRSLIGDMTRGSKSTRERAFNIINKSFGPGVRLQRVTLANRGDGSAALWSILKPRYSVTVVEELPENTSEQERGSLSQDCVAVNYILVGTSLGLVCDGLWTLEVPDHALGRAVERSRLLHPGTIIMDAHQSLLDLPATPETMNSLGDGAYIKAGSGCFTAHINVGPDVSAGNDWSVTVRVKTWLDNDMLSDRQIVMSEKGEEGQRMGDGWLMPHPLKIIDKTEPNRFDVSAWNPWKEEATK